MNHSTPTNRLGLVSLAFLLVAPVIGVAAVPVVSSSRTVEIHYAAGRSGDVQFGYRIVATGAPTSFEATGLPSGATLDRSTGWINGSRNTTGVYNVAVRATNADGVGTATVRLAIHPAATGVISSPGSFRAGESFTFTVRYNAPVTVTGTPSLALVIGSAAAPTFKNAVYASGSGTTELVFRYVVASGDLDLDGVQLLPSAPAGGSIRDVHGLTASSSLPVRHFVSGIKIVSVATGGIVGSGSAAPSVALQQ